MEELHQKLIQAGNFADMQDAADALIAQMRRHICDGNILIVDMADNDLRQVATIGVQENVTWIRYSPDQNAEFTMAGLNLKVATSIRVTNAV